MNCLFENFFLFIYFIQKKLSKKVALLFLSKSHNVIQSIYMCVYNINKYILGNINLQLTLWPQICVIPRV